MNKALIAAALAAATMPVSGGAVVVPREAGLGGWFSKNRPKRQLTKRQRSVSALQRKGWTKIPCEAPAGYRWHQAAAGKRKFYLSKCPPGERVAEYDPVHDRTIVHNTGWGNVKPVYLRGDQT